jgi:hypothetical protein
MLYLSFETKEGQATSASYSARPTEAAHSRLETTASQPLEIGIHRMIYRGLKDSITWKLFTMLNAVIWMISLFFCESWISVKMYPNMTDDLRK